MALYDPQNIVGHIFASHKPRYVLASAAQAARLQRFHVGPFGFDAPNAQALALAQGVETQAHMLADGAPRRVFDRARLFGDVAVQKVTERSLPNEANAGRIFLFRIGQANLLRNAAHFCFLQLAHWEQSFGELLLIKPV